MNPPTIKCCSHLFSFVKDINFCNNNYHQPKSHNKDETILYRKHFHDYHFHTTPPFLLLFFPFFQSTFLLLHLLPPACAAYKSGGDRLAPQGMSQPGARSKASAPDTPRLCSETPSQGDIYMKGTSPSHPSLKTGGKEGLSSQRVQGQEKATVAAAFMGPDCRLYLD